MNKIGFIGAGKVGFSFGKFFSLTGLSDVLTGYYSKNFESALKAAEFTSSKAYETLRDLVLDSNMIFITVPDSKIGEIWEQCKELDIAGKIFCHCSGALSSAVFSGIEELGAYGYSIHPFMAVADPYTAYREFPNALFTIEGSQTYLSELVCFLQEIGLNLQTITKEVKLRYHASASLSANCMVGLAQIAINNLIQCGFSEENAKLALKPIMLGNLTHILETSPVEALTGPLERGDLPTLKGHLSVLEGNDREVYRLLSKEILKTAKEKNPDRNYQAVETLLNEEMHNISENAFK